MFLAVDCYMDGICRIDDIEVYALHQPGQAHAIDTPGDVVIKAINGTGISVLPHDACNLLIRESTAK